MHATQVVPFRHDGWVYEEKVDAYRTVAVKANGVGRDLCSSPVALGWIERPFLWYAYPVTRIFRTGLSSGSPKAQEASC